MPSDERKPLVSHDYGGDLANVAQGKFFQRVMCQKIGNYSNHLDLIVICMSHNGAKLPVRSTAYWCHCLNRNISQIM